MSKASAIRFTDMGQAFPTLPRDRRQLSIVRADAGTDGGCFWEFMVEEVPNVAVQVQMFSDSWSAYRDIPEFFAALVEMGEGTTFEAIKELCAELGYYDRTAHYVQRHQHMFKCACGERKSA